MVRCHAAVLRLQPSGPEWLNGDHAACIVHVQIVMSMLHTALHHSTTRLHVRNANAGYFHAIYNLLCALSGVRCKHIYCTYGIHFSLIVL